MISNSTPRAGQAVGGAGAGRTLDGAGAAPGGAGDSSGGAGASYDGGAAAPAGAGQAAGQSSGVGGRTFEGNAQPAPATTITYSGGGFAYIPVSGEVLYKVVVIKESRSGMNLRFLDKSNNREMTTKQFCDAIRAGEYPGYYIRGGVVPVSRPNTNTSDNLG